MHFPDWMFQAIGWTGQALFTARMLVQWYCSEKAKKSVAPPAFWWLSMGGTLLLLWYAAFLKDPIFLLAPAANLFFYARNLALSAGFIKRSIPTPILFIIALACAVLIAITLSAKAKNEFLTQPPFWLVLGLTGSGLWIFRFLLQWFISERKGQSIFPASFWLVSLAGAGALLAYSINKGILIFIVGYSFPIPVILRNLLLIKSSK